VNKRAQRKPAAEGLLAQREQLDREQRVPSKLKEIGMNADRSDPEQALPDLGQLPLRLVTRLVGAAASSEAAGTLASMSNRSCVEREVLCKEKAPRFARLPCAI
jgi:hypothetical protein